jgi:hypothetical protein
MCRYDNHCHAIIKIINMHIDILVGYYAHISMTDGFPGMEGA